MYEETTSSSSLIHTSISLYCILCYLVINFQKLWTFLKVFAKAFIRTICYDVDDTYILRNKSERSNESTLKESIINCQYKKMLQCDLALDFFSVYFLLKKGGLIASSSFSFGWLLKGKVCAQSSLSKQVWISQAKRWSIDFSLKTIIQDPSNMGIDNKDPFLILLFLPPLWVVMLFLMAPTTAFIVRRTMMVWVCIYIITDVLIEIILLSSIQCTQCWPL